MDLMPVIVVQAVGLIVTVAAVKTTLGGHENRIGKLEGRSDDMADHETRIVKLEKCMDDLPKNYVPRNEVQLMLQAITSVVADTKATVNDTNAMIKALIYAGGNREVAKKGLDPTK